jgi:mannosyltransferase OCH1-like enzyme
MIPNIVHFIYPVWPLTRPLSYVNYMAVKMAIAVQKPDKVKFWINKDPEPSRWWDKIKEMVDVVYTPMDGVYRNVNIEWPQLQSDVTRLEILQREGGIYLDTDMLVLHSMEALPFLKHNFIIGFEPGETSMCNALMMSEPEAPFIKLWLDKMPEALQSTTWAQGGVVTPLELWKDNSSLAMAAEANWFCPLGLDKNWMFDPALADEAQSRVTHSFSVHIFETYFRDIVKDITPEWCDQNDSLFSRLTAPYRD